MIEKIRGIFDKVLPTLSALFFMIGVLATAIGVIIRWAEFEDCVGGRGNKIYDHLGGNVIDGNRFQKGHTDKAYTAV